MLLKSNENNVNILDSCDIMFTSFFDNGDIDEYKFSPKSNWWCFTH